MKPGCWLWCQIRLNCQTTTRSLLSPIKTKVIWYCLQKKKKTDNLEKLITQLCNVFIIKKKLITQLCNVFIIKETYQKSSKKIINYYKNLDIYGHFLHSRNVFLKVSATFSKTNITKNVFYVFYLKISIKLFIRTYVVMYF